MIKVLSWNSRCVNIICIGTKDGLHCKNKIVKITKLLVSTVARNNLNCNLICRVGCYGYTVIIIE